eukprot:c20868_g1_i1 orf=164-787(+)
MAASILVLLLLIFLGGVCALRFDVSSTFTRCLAEEIQSNVLVLAVYRVVLEDATKQEKLQISAKVTSPYGSILHSVENVSSGRFSFTTKESGNYAACFWLPPTLHGETVSVELDWKTGIIAKDWETIARKDKIEGVELELMKLQGAVEAIHENLQYLRHREKEMRDISELTNMRMAWFSIASLTVCLLVAGWQLWHLKRYFEKKKLI